MAEHEEQHTKSISFFNDRKVRAVWGEENSKWWLSVLNLIAAINEQEGYQKTRNYWKNLKTKLKRENYANPFMEGNGRSTRIWLDLMLKRSLKRCVDWSQIDKNEYLTAMRESVADSTLIKTLVLPTLTTKIDDREMFMKGIDYSYYYEQND